MIHPELPGLGAARKVPLLSRMFALRLALAAALAAFALFVAPVLVTEPGLNFAVLVSGIVLAIAGLRRLVAHDGPRS